MKRFLLSLSGLILGLAASIEAQVENPTTATKPDSDNKGSEVRPTRSVDTRSMPQSIATIKRLSELRRELNISESSVRARIILPSDQLFEESNPTKIDRFAVAVLTKVAEYLRLTDKRNMTLTSHYLPEKDEDRSIAQNRLISLVQWFETTGNLPTNVLQSAPPASIETIEANKGIEDTIEIDLLWDQVARPEK